MPDRTVKRRLEDTRDAALASDDGPIFSTVAKLVDGLKRSIPEGTENAKLKKRSSAPWTRPAPRDHVRVRTNRGP